MLHRLRRAKQIARSGKCGTATLDRGLADNLSHLQATASRDEGGGLCPRMHVIAVRGSLGRCRPWGAPHPPSLTGSSVGWVSPIDIVRLLLVRRCPKPFHHQASIRHSTILSAVVPGFGELVAEQGLPRPTIARPILPIGLRTALLAGVSIVYQAGPTLVSELKRQTLGAHYTVRCHRRRHVGFEKLSAAAGELRLRGIGSHD